MDEFLFHNLVVNEMLKNVWAELCENKIYGLYCVG